MPNLTSGRTITLLVLGLLLTAQAEIRWHDQSRLLKGFDLNGVAWTGSRYVAVGEQGMIMSSTDGVAWQAGDSLTSKWLDWVVWTGTQLIAFGGGRWTTWLTSPDGISWSSNVVLDWDLYGAVWTPSQIVAVGDSGVIVTSTDLKNWTQQISPTTTKLNDVTWTGSQFIAVGDSGVILTSADGITWKCQPSPATDWITRIVWTGGLLVATGPGNLTLTSPDGISWTEDRLYPGIWQVVHGDSLTYGVGEYDSRLYTSTDGVSWTALPAPEGAADLTGLTINGNQLVLVGDSLTVITVDPAHQMSLRWKGGIGGLNGVTRTRNGLIAVGEKGAVITSRDGVAWRRHSAPTTYDLDLATWTDSLLVVGFGSSIFTSPEGASWTKRELGTSSNLDALLWNGKQLVAVGYGGAILTSPDGISWTKQNAQTTEHLYCIGWSGTEYLVGSSSQYVYTSPDGVNWTRHSKQQSTTIYSIASSGSRWVATGYDLIFSSPDAEQWEEYRWTTYLFQGLSLVWTGRQFVAGGSSDTLFMSPDGLSWTPHYTGRAVGPLAWTDSLLVTAGEYNRAGLLMSTTLDDLTATRRPSISLQPAKHNRTMVYSGPGAHRHAADGWIFAPNGKKIRRYDPRRPGSGFSPASGVANGVWIIRD